MDPGGQIGHEVRPNRPRSPVSCALAQNNRAHGAPKARYAGFPMSVKSEERYGRLRVLGVANRTTAAAGHKYFRCVCDCGREVEVRGTHLSQGRTTSCGCSRRGARGGIENYRARCNDEERRREAVEAAARMMAEARWSAPDADREQPRRAGRIRARAEDPPPAPPPAPAPICGRCGWETAPPRERICARCGWVMMAWQVEKEHDAL